MGPAESRGVGLESGIKISYECELSAADYQALVPDYGEGAKWRVVFFPGDAEESSGWPLRVQSAMEISGRASFSRTLVWHTAKNNLEPGARIHMGITKSAKPSEVSLPLELPAVEAAEE